MLRKVIVVKAIILVGLLSAYFLPVEQAVAVNAAANGLWLFYLD